MTLSTILLDFLKSDFEGPRVLIVQITDVYPLEKKTCHDLFTHKYESLYHENVIVTGLMKGTSNRSV